MVTSGFSEASQDCPCMRLASHDIESFVIVAILVGAVMSNCNITFPGHECLYVQGGYHFNMTACKLS